ncbi:hypothetical protein OHR86_22550 [Streptomyces sp. NBC_00441]|uniref:hypothetical protein n=1 Tax=Streptomyces sp. NBC_00441 TaxID=2975742 RepID=UPI002E287DFE|nr:hypothetical protein [Streptomyces sp. NBC_00441]
MFVTRARYDALYARYVEVLDQRDAAVKSAKESGDSVIQLAASTARAGQDLQLARGLLRKSEQGRHNLRGLLEHLRDTGSQGVLRTTHNRLTRALRACARYRAENARMRRQVAQLHAAYDNAVGLDSPALDMGVHWQQRRSDRPVPKAVES